MQNLSFTNSDGFRFSNNIDRGVLGSIFNANAIYKEDLINSETQANNQMLRDLYVLGQANEFNAMESQKQRDFEERLSNTAYQRAMVDMKKAGINPVMLVNQGGAMTPSGASASSSGYSGLKGNLPNNNNSADLLHFIGTIFSAVANLGKGFIGDKKTKIIKKYIVD